MAYSGDVNVAQSAVVVAGESLEDHEWTRAGQTDGESDGASAAISAGACGYLVKTARPEQIVEAIHEAARGGSPMSPMMAASVVKLLAKLTKPMTPVSLSPREREMLALIVEA